MAQPLIQQQPIVDPETGRLTEEHWWFLFSLRNDTSDALNSFSLNTVDLDVTGGSVTPDLKDSGPVGSFHIGLTSFVRVNVLIPLNPRAGAEITFLVDQDSNGFRPAPLFQVGIGGFTAEVSDIAILEYPNTRTIYGFVFDGVSWTLKTFMTGLNF